MVKMTKKLAKRLRIAVVTALIAIFGIVSLPLGSVRRNTVSAEEQTADTGSDTVVDAKYDSIEVTFNYYRPSGSYTGDNVWVWSVDGTYAGNGYAFTDTKEFPGYEGKKWATATVKFENIDVNADGQLFGVIYRNGGEIGTGQWGEDSDVTKDSGDMFILESKLDPTTKKVEVFYVAQSKTLFYTVDDAMSNKITAAFFNKFDGVHIETSKTITDKSVFKVKNGEGEVVGTYDCAKEKLAENAVSLNITLDAELDLSDKYTVCDEPVGEFDKSVNFLSRDVIKNQLYGTEAFGNRYNYDGFLGSRYNADSGKTEFAVWSPAAKTVALNIYDAGEDGEAETQAMTKGEKGVWSVDVTGNLSGKYYTYVVNSSAEIVDPYAKSAGKNGKRGMIVDLDATDPEGWADQKDPVLESNSKAVIYEAQLRDLTIHESSNVSAANRGKFLGLTEKGSDDKTTPLEYIQALGVTAVHFQPLFDFASVDESFKVATYNKDGEYNWGYDPLNYNVPEGSYSSDPSDGAARVSEMKQMIMALHNEGIQVVMDVVYNHVSDHNSSNFQTLVPGYYFRSDKNGEYCNGSGCGNETASERYMFRRFMIDSVKYWTEEYKIDGFRFDLMGLHDVETMNAIYDELVKINPDVIIYGEGWTAAPSGMPADSAAAVKANAKQMPNIAVFNDDFRDGMKGGVFEIRSTGFVSGSRTDSAVYVGAAGWCACSTLNTSSQVNNPTQNVNYVSAHDNNTLWDKLNCSINTDEDTLKAMNRLAATSVLTSQGISFFLAGEELLRSKPTTEKNDYGNNAQHWVTDEDVFVSGNSYKSPDSVNAIDWSLAEKNADMVEFYTNLIAIKKTFPQFSLTTAAQINSCLTVADNNKYDGVAYYAVKDPNSNSHAIVILNAAKEAKEIAVPQASYKVYVEGAVAKSDISDPIKTFEGDKYTVGAYSAVVMIADMEESDVDAWYDSLNKKPSTTDDKTDGTDGGKGNGLALGLGLGLGLGIPLVIAAVVVAVVLVKKKGAKAGSKSDKNGGD